MNAVAAVAVMLSLVAPVQEPGTYAQAKVLEKVRALGFLPHQIVALRDAAVRVDQFTADFRKGESTLEAQDAALAPLLEALASGKALNSQQTALLRESTAKRKALSDEWEARVQGVVTRVLATLHEDQRYQLGVPLNVRQRVDSHWNSFQSATGADADRVARDLVSRLMRKEYDRVRQANSGGSDRGRQQDRRQMSQNMRAMSAEIQRQGQQFLDLVRQGNPAAVRGFHQQLAQSYMQDGDVDRNLRELIKSIITAKGATPALTAAAAG